MTLQEYEEIKNSLLKKRKKGNITNLTKRVYICFVLCYDIVTKEMENKTRRS